MSPRRCVMKEFHKLLQNAGKLYDGQVEFVLNDDDKTEEGNETEDDGEVKNYLDFLFFVTTNEGLYRNARIKFKMRVVFGQYPFVAPEITCMNNIYHPNIDIQDENGEGIICVSLLDSDWTPEVGLEGAVMAVLFLFYNPQLDDFLSVAFDEDDDYDVYAVNVRRSLRGGHVGEHTFDNLLNESTNIEDNEDTVNRGSTKDAGVKIEDEACAVTSKGILDNVEKENTTSQETLENVGKIDTDLEEIFENVEKANTASEVILENVKKVDDATDKIVENVEQIDAASKEIFEKVNAVSEVILEHAEKAVDASDKILENVEQAASDEIMENVDLDLSHQTTTKFPVLKLWCSKVKNIFSPIQVFFNKRS